MSLTFVVSKEKCIWFNIRAISSLTIFESAMFDLTSVDQYYRLYLKIDNYLKMDSYWCQLNYRLSCFPLLGSKFIRKGVEWARFESSEMNDSEFIPDSSGYDRRTEINIP